ncbi:MAG: exopolysaccharide transport family protein [Pseudomonadota bacterium]
MRELHASERFEAAPSQPFSTSTFENFDFFAAIWRRRALVALSVVGALVLGVVAMVAIEPKYTVNSKVMVETRDARVPELQAAMGRETVDEAVVRSEAFIFLSLDVIERAVRGLGPAFFDPAKLAEFEADAASPRTAGATAALSDRQAARLAEDVRDRLIVSAEEKSYVIDLRYTDEDAARASGILNAVVETYIENSATTKAKSNVAAREHLEERLTSVRAQLDAAESRLADAMLRVGQLGGIERTTTAEDLTQLGKQLNQLKEEAAGYRADLDAVNSFAAGGEAVFEFVSFDAPQLDALMESRAEVLRQLGLARAELRPAHPRRATLEKEAAAVEKNVERELLQLRANLSSRLAQNDRAQGRLADERRRILETSSDDVSAAVDLRQLEGEAETLRNLYADILQRLSAIREYADPDAWVIARARTPERPSWPDPKVIFALGGLGGILFGCFLAVLREMADTRVASVDEVSSIMGARSVGMLPPYLGPARDETALLNEINADPGKPSFEVLRSIAMRAVSQKKRPDQGVVLSMFSALPSEGKTTTISTLAAIAARDGARVLLVDADFRAPSVGDLLGLYTGASAAWPDRADKWRDAVRVSDVTGLHVLAPSQAVHDPLQLPRQEALVRALREARSSYDLITVDLPPILPIVDPLLLLDEIDQIYFLAADRRVRRRELEEAAVKLSESNAQVDGVLLTLVPAQKVARAAYYMSNNYRYAKNSYSKRKTA